MSNLDLSLILTCYNESKILEKSVEEIREVLDKTTYTYEIIFVDDGSKDNSRELIKDICAKNPGLMRFSFHEKNKGRGQAVTTGINLAKGYVVGYVDTDLETPAYYIPEFIYNVKNKYDVVTGLRFYSFSVSHLLRLITSLGYKLLFRKLLKSPIKDSETGCKFFNREKLLDVLPLLKANHWFWDTEVMVESYKKGYKIYEMPTVFIRKIDEKGSAVNLFKDTYTYFFQLINYRKRLKKRGVL